VTVNNIGGLEAKPRIAVTKNQFPTTSDIAQLLSDMRGYWPDSAHLFACSKAAQDARNNEITLAL
jgi:hypothetical protein